jgi:hypothetical protein
MKEQQMMLKTQLVKDLSEQAVTRTYFQYKMSTASNSTNLS